MQAINPLQDSLRPLSTCFNYAVGDWRAVWHSEEIIRSLHMHGAEDRGR
jgi:hypothetical protein